MHSGPSEDPAAASEGAWDGTHAGLASSGALRLLLKIPADGCTQEDSIYPTWLVSQPSLLCISAARLERRGDLERTCCLQALCQGQRGLLLGAQLPAHKYLRLPACLFTQQAAGRQLPRMQAYPLACKHQWFPSDRHQVR